MNEQDRELLIQECITMTADLNGVPEFFVDHKEFESLDDEDLIAEHDWLCRMLYDK